ncbi:hypothetical protein HPB49_017835 [Dermacentor silvarum]|uniref:Uncharacterized protein n=1 Tax=Dermacentor silvarum TaxID=543639 RepID=A0ACB8CM12_DERSI|nr:hypothetical protein HPB49_017835 [Dermacentor silvarum]
MCPRSAGSFCGNQPTSGWRDHHHDDASLVLFQLMNALRRRFSGRTINISILIGSDFYWDVVTGQVSRLSPQVTAVETRFGWTVQGTLHNFSQGSTVQRTSVVFGTEESPRDDAPMKSPKGEKRPPPTRLSIRNKVTQRWLKVTAKDGFMYSKRQFNDEYKPDNTQLSQ